MVETLCMIHSGVDIQLYTFPFQKEGHGGKKGSLVSNNFKVQQVNSVRFQGWEKNLLWLKPLPSRPIPLLFAPVDLCYSPSWSRYWEKMTKILLFWFSYMKIQSELNYRLTCVRACSDVYNSLRSYELMPTRLLCPWEFPGMDTGMGCHFLFQTIFPTQGSSPHLCISCIGRQFLYHWTTWEAQVHRTHMVQEHSLPMLCSFVI